MNSYFITIYVNDIYLLSHHTKKLQSIQESLKSICEMIDLEDLNHSLGLEYHFTHSGIITTQHGYALKMFLEFG